MFTQQENDPLTAAAGGGRRNYLRSVSWTDRSPTRPLPSPRPNPNPNSKARSCLPPLQPLSIARRPVEEWPTAGSDDLGVWPNPQTPKPLENPNSDLPPIREFQFKKDKLAFFDKECSRIADHVYLGSDAVAKNREILRENRITHVLNCVGFVCPEYFKDDLVYKTLWLQDSPSEDITSVLYDVFDYFEDVREQGGRVLVHCCQGISRSTSLVIAYLMWREGQSFEDAFQYVKAARGVTNPNMGFACQLLQCQKRVHAVPASPNSVLRIYRMAPHSSYDPLHLVPKLLNRSDSQGLDSRGAFIIHVPTAIFVWVGKGCDSVMLTQARAAASQVVRYERAQGPVLTIKEGEEPLEFWDALGTKDETFSSGYVGNTRRVDGYDLDFDLFHKALAGGVVPPFSGSTGRTETCLPAREGGWGKLRQKFASGMMKEFLSPSKSPSTSSQPASPCGPSDPIDDPLSSGYKSPTLSPSNSDYSSSSFAFSPSSSNWSDLSYLSSRQPSPSSGLEKTSLPSPGKVFDSGQTLRLDAFCVKSKGISPSIAERRGSNPPPLETSNVNVSRSLVRSWSFSLEDHDELFEDEKMVDAEDLNFSEPILYRWPELEKLDISRFGVLDSKSVYVMLVSELNGIGIVYVWLGRDFSEMEISGEVMDSCRYWEAALRDFRDRNNFPADTPLQVIRQGEEPEQFLNLVSGFSFQDMDSRPKPR